MNQYYLNQHKRQIVGFEGLNLAGDWRWEILMGARNISRDSVLQFNHTQFHVTSQSHSGTFHSIDLNLMTCDRQDFPRIWFCKHIAVIHLHFPHLEQSDPIITWEGNPDPDSDSDSDSRSESGSASTPKATLLEEILTLTCEIISLSQNLASKKINQSHYPAVIEALQSTKYSLTVADALVQGTSALLDKELIPPNQNSWSETAARMGINQLPKRKCLPKECRLTEQAIGITNRCRRTHNDPYSAGECSGMQAKPDVLSHPPPATAPA
jgi:hypothetical protein